MVKVPSLNFLRCFSTTPSCLKRPHFKPLRGTDPSIVPTYPHGPSRWYKQSNLGLYGLQKIRSGNIVSSKNEIKTRRVWKPNVHHRRLWSMLLNRYLRLRITTRVMRTVDKCGGLDNYLLGDSVARIKELGVTGWALRWRLMQTEEWKAKHRAEMIRLGLRPQKNVPLIGIKGAVVDKETYEEDLRAFDQGLEDTEEFALEDALQGEGSELADMDELSKVNQQPQAL